MLAYNSNTQPFNIEKKPSNPLIHIERTEFILNESKLSKFSTVVYSFI